MIKSLFKKKKSKQPAQKTDAQIKREERIKEVSAKSGLSEIEAKRMMEYAKDKYGILYGTFLKNEFWKVPDDDRDKAYCDYLHSKKKLRARCLEMLQKTGLSEEESKESLLATKEALGITNQNYLRYEFYKLTPEKQRKAYIALLDNGKLFHGNRLRLEYAVLRVTKSTGWSYKTARTGIEEARKKYGITAVEYYLDKFYAVPLEEQPAFANRIIAERKLKKSYEEAAVQRLEAEEAEHYAHIMQQGNWTLEQAKEEVAKSGVSAGNFMIYQFEKLLPAERDTYMTSTQSAKVRAKYAKDQRYTRGTMFIKDLFNDEFAEYLHRKCLSTAAMQRETFKDTFQGENKILYKPRDGVGGHGIKFYEIANENDLDAAYDDILLHPFGIVESFIVQHPEMQRLSANSVNTIRIVTIRTTNPEKKIETEKVHFLYAALRMSVSDSHVDNLHSGGAAAAVDLSTGRLLTGAVTHTGECYNVHPLTGEQILGFQIPYFAEAKALVEKAILEKDLEGYYGWDVAITKDGPLFIEGNNNPGVDALQLPYVPQRKGMRHIFDKYMK